MNAPSLARQAETLAGLLPSLAGRLLAVDADLATRLPLAQLRVCSLLDGGLRTMSALARELGVSLSAMTQIADRLERTRLVKRVAEANDRRVRCLQLTPRGQQLMREREAERVLRARTALERLSEAAREKVLSALEQLLAASGGPAGGAIPARPACRPGGPHFRKRRALS